MKRETASAVQKDPSAPTTFGPPLVSSTVMDPAALRYAAEAGGRLAPNRYNAPVAGGKTPPIPMLDGPASKNATMSEQAAPPPRAAPPPTGGGIFGGAPMPLVPPRGPLTGPPARAAAATQAPLALRPGDMLPPAAREDPEFREGHGSMFATSQPNLARKYGVIRGKEQVPPQMLAPPPTTLSEGTIQDLRALQELQSARQVVESGDARAEREATAGPAGMAGRLGNSPNDGPAASPDASQANIQEAVRRLDDFDFNTFREMMMKDILNNEEQRKIIEEKLTPLDLSDLIMQGFVTQRIPIIPNVFEPTFRSMSGEEDLAIKRLVMEESKGVAVSDRYLLDKFSMMSVAIGVYSINGNVMPSHLNSEGRFEAELFWKKFNLLIRYPFHMLASLGVNYFWFDIRVRKLFVAEKVGNG